jgi:hypothetical protein
MADEDSAMMAKWGRKMERREEEERKATESMKEVISKAMKDKGTHDNITNQLKRARQGGDVIKERAEYGDDGEIITGNPEDCPWTRD